MRFKRSPIAWVIFLSLPILGSCAHGPQLNVCASNPALSEFECQRPSTLFHHPKPTSLPYAQTKGMQVYPPESFLAIEDYCVARHDPATQAPNFWACEADPENGGVGCSLLTCEVIPQGAGLTCHPSPTNPVWVPWAQTENYIGLSAIDRDTLFAFCNIKVEGAVP
jgi:hypothetical protein